jgi:hypothetical protein
VPIRRRCAGLDLLRVRVRGLVTVAERRSARRPFVQHVAHRPVDFGDWGIENEVAIREESKLFLQFHSKSPWP